MRSWRRYVLVTSMALGACGCVSQPLLSPSPPAPPPPPPPPVATDISPIGTPGLGSTAREFAGPGTYLAPMPTAVVILREDQRQRNLAFCNEFRNFPDVNAPEDEEASQFTNRILTRWLLVKRVRNDRLQTCDAMLEDYDYVRAQRLLARFEPPAGTDAPGVLGPYIMQFLPNGSVILVDGSTAQGSSEIREWTRGWLSSARNQITEAKVKSTGGSPIAEKDQPWWDSVGPDVARFLQDKVPFGRTILGFLKAVSRPG